MVDSAILVRTGTGIPTFRGSHNQNKGKVFFFLSQERDSGRWFTARELNLILGVPLHSLLTSLKHWTDWRRLTRRQRYGIEYEYRILQKGLDWVERWQFIMPMGRYISEISMWQAHINTPSEV